MGARVMQIILEGNRDWVYLLKRQREPGINYIAETMVKVGFGMPTSGILASGTLFDGYRLLSLYSTSYAGEWLYANSDYCEGNRKLHIDEVDTHVVELLLNKLRTRNPAGEFYNRQTLFGCTGMILTTYEDSHEWTIKPVLDERLWQRYVDSVNRAAADAVVR